MQNPGPYRVSIDYKISSGKSKGAILMDVAEAKTMLKKGNELVLELELEKAIKLYSDAVVDLTLRYGCICQMPAELRKSVEDVQKRLPLYKNAVPHLVGVKEATVILNASTWNPALGIPRSNLPGVPMGDTLVKVPLSSISSGLKCAGCGLIGDLGNLSPLSVIHYKCDLCYLKDFRALRPDQNAEGHAGPPNKRTFTFGVSDPLPNQNPKRRRGDSGNANSNNRRRVFVVRPDGVILAPAGGMSSSTQD